MAFTESWDEATPTDTDFADEGDDEIRKIKRMLSERLPQVLFGWPNTDPLKLLSAALDIGILAIGKESELPNPALTFFYLTTDGGKLYAKEADTFVLISGGATSGTSDVSNISFDSLRKKTIVTTKSIAGTAAGISDQNIVLTAVGASYGDYIVLGARLRAKRATTASYSELGSWTGDAGASAKYAVDEAAGFNKFGVSSYSIIEQHNGADLDFVVNFMLNNLTGGAADAEIECTLFLLCLNGDVAAD